MKADHMLHQTAAIGMIHRFVNELTNVGYMPDRIKG